MLVLNLHVVMIYGLFYQTLRQDGFAAMNKALWKYNLASKFSDISVTRGRQFLP